MVRKKVITLYLCIATIMLVTVSLTLILPYFLNKKEASEYEPVRATDPSEFISVDGFVIDNSKSLEDLLTTEYSLEELEKYFGKNASLGAGIVKEASRDLSKSYSWDEVNSKFPVECLRYNICTHYSVYKVKEGGFFYVIWMVLDKSTPKEILDENELIRAYYSIYIDELASIDDFKPLRKLLTARDVFERDAQMEIIFGYGFGGARSYNLLDSGEVLVIRYEKTKIEQLSDLKVDEYEILPKEVVSSALSNIFDKDLPK